AYLANAANNIDENSVTLITDESELAAAKTLYINNCAACHANDGGGGVGPNFCDDYFLNGGSINDIFSTIKYGIVENGMKSWKDDFSPKQMAAIASYVKHLQGTKPAIAKEPQGKLESSQGQDATPSAPETDDPNKE